MNKLNCLKTSVAIAALLVLPMAQAATMTKGDHSAAKSRISEQYKADDSACKSLAGNTKDVCVQEAKAKEKVAYAELEYAYTGKPADQTKVRVAKAESAYAVAKEKCDDMAGNAKDVCVKEAKAVETKALADAKLGKEVGEAQKEATEDKTSADYSVAKEKCDALAGDAKSACVDAAKAKYSKM
jgi:hypothetical protein